MHWISSQGPGERLAQELVLETCAVGMLGNKGILVQLIPSEAISRQLIQLVQLFQESSAAESPALPWHPAGAREAGSLGVGVGASLESLCYWASNFSPPCSPTALRVQGKTSRS